MVVDYVSKWLEAIVLPTNDFKGVINFMKINILNRFGTPWAIISDGGFHVSNRMFMSFLSKMGFKIGWTHPTIL